MESQTATHQAAKEVISLSVNETLAKTGISRKRFYEEVNAGRLIVRKLGRRTLVPAEEIRRWIDALPVYQPHQAA